MTSFYAPRNQLGHVMIHERNAISSWAWIAIFSDFSFDHKRKLWKYLVQRPFHISTQYSFVVKIHIVYFKLSEDFAKFFWDSNLWYE